MKKCAWVAGCGAAMLGMSVPALGQSLFRQAQAPTNQASPPASAPTQAPATGSAPAAAAPAAPSTQASSQESRPQSHELRQTSLMMVEAPKPKSIGMHEIIFIIINETSTQSSQQTLDATKDASLKAAVNSFPDIGLFFQGNLRNTNSGPVASADMTGSSAYKGDGKFQRNDKFTDRIAATVIDVKPNGTLVVEARKTVGQDKETRTLVLSGECRREDVTDNNTVLSSQLAELTILAHTEGDTKDTASKGFLTKIVEGIFNF
jgi:flagellar L-ring protein precursor FlgH